MSIKSDHWIKRQCTMPTFMVTELVPVPRHVFFVPEERTYPSWEPKEALEEKCRLYNSDLPSPGRTGVTSFRTLTSEEKAAFKPMIEPFAPNQVRFKERPATSEEYNRAVLFSSSDAAAAALGVHSIRVDPILGYQILEKIISYGTSSYGYDLRCGREFKIFTNVNSCIVDPKNFDPNSFIDVVTTDAKPYIIIPPNSFALARTVEYLRIPRNVLTVCLGKSTYARCFTGETKVALVDGTSVIFEEMVKRAAKGERFWGYSTSRFGTIEVAELTAPRKVGHEKVIEVMLDNGEAIRCTPDHKFLMRDGQYVEAKDLKAEDSLMPLYRGEYRGYESVYQPAQGRMVSTHWLSDLWNIRNGIYEATENTHRHHRDHARRNNNPINVSRMPAGEHRALHESEKWLTDESRQLHGEKIKASLERLKEDEDWFNIYSNTQKAKAMSFHHDPIHAEARERWLTRHVNHLKSAERRAVAADHMRTHFLKEGAREIHGKKMKAAWANDEVRRERQKEVARNINLREEITTITVESALKVAGSIRGAARHLKCDRSVFRRFPEVLSNFFQTPVANNHKVIGVKEIEGTHDVYCLTVPEHGNFALESGVFVKNCGIIVNVTPFEPEWEGYVTLEFSNTSPLPAKIYANEGCAQVLFFESDEVCEISYKDRDGKYMGQQPLPVTPQM